MRAFKLRSAVALGGFLIFMGIIMIGIFAMIFFGFANVSALENQEYRMLALWILLVVGAFDLLAGVLLRRR
ncbi:MAG: hypothetical protein PVF15_11190 [Candidatus Bathyarchaeota archaeon]|jgi:hypothetical protein